jgi:hypothetical protein
MPKTFRQFLTEFPRGKKGKLPSDGSRRAKKLLTQTSTESWEMVNSRADGMPAWAKKTKEPNVQCFFLKYEKISRLVATLRFAFATWMVLWYRKNNDSHQFMIMMMGLLE